MYFSLASHSAKSLVEAFYRTENMQCIMRHKKSKIKTKQIQYKKSLQLNLFFQHEKPRWKKESKAFEQRVYLWQCERIHDGEGLSPAVMREPRRWSLMVWEWWMWEELFLVLCVIGENVWHVWICENNELYKMK